MAPDENPQFVPPEDGRNAPQPSQPTYATPFGADGPVLPQSPRKRRPWRVVIIVVSAALALSLLIVGLTFLARAVASRIVPNAGTGEAQSLVKGDAGSPLAADPLECPTACFNADSIPATMPSQTSLQDLGLTRTTFTWGTYDPTTAGQLHRSNIPGWKNLEGRPDACFFAPGNSPASFTDSDDSTDEIQWTGTETTEDKRNTIDQSVRFFPDSTTASAYLTDLADQISQCDLIEIGSGQDYYSAKITPAPALELPSSVAAVGWVRTGEPGIRWRAYIIDLQRGNLVVRTRLLTDGSITEVEYRHLVEVVAAQIEQIQPLAS